jgi:protease-4
MRKTLVVIVVAVIVFVAAIAIFSSSLPGPISAESKIAIIPITGTIVYGEGGLFTESGANPITINELLDKADKDPAYKAIVLEINSPGGSPVASDEIARKIESLNKTTVAWIGDMGTSGAYWVASSADQVVAHPLSLTCNLGALATVGEFSELFEKIGMNFTTMKYGEYKDIGSPYRPITAEEEELLQQMADDIGLYFIEKISENRGMPPSVVQDIADGSPCLGMDAYDLGLVDELGNKEDAIELAAEIAGVKRPKPVRLVRERDMLSELFGINWGQSFYSMGTGLGDSLKEESEISLVS